MKSCLLIFSFLTRIRKFLKFHPSVCLYWFSCMEGKTQRACLLKMQRPSLIYWHPKRTQRTRSFCWGFSEEWWVHTETGRAASVGARRRGVVRFFDLLSRTHDFLSLLLQRLCLQSSSVAFSPANPSNICIFFFPDVQLGLSLKGWIYHPLFFSGFRIKRGENPEGLTTAFHRNHPGYHLDHVTSQLS